MPVQLHNHFTVGLMQMVGFRLVLVLPWLINSTVSWEKEQDGRWLQPFGKDPV